jgi:hypothetical protein
MNFTEPKNKNYSAVIVRLDHFVALQNCDNVKAALIFGNSVIVSKSVESGAVGLFFPVETALNTAFLKNNNLYRKPELNADPAKKGYFEEHGRIKTVAFRGHKSEGFWIPLESLSYLGIPLADLPMGVEFDNINGSEICRKYIPKSNRVSGQRSVKGSRKPAEERIVPGQFSFHIDTAQLGRNTHRIQPSTVISISDKWHGTSAIFSHVLVQRNLTWLERLLQRFGVKVQDQEYGFTWASRKVIKGINEKAKDGVNHFYSTDIWSVVGEKIKPLIPKGYTIYGEIVGFLPDGGMIQKGYHYGCQPGEHRFLVYRVTCVNVDGKVIELSWNAMKEFCEKFGLEMVAEFYFGRADGFLPMAPQQQENEWQESFLKVVQERYVRDAMCPHNAGEVPLEGVVVRVERYNECESYKLKSFLFKKRESDAADAGEVDVETIESESEEAVEAESDQQALA